MQQRRDRAAPAGGEALGDEHAPLVLEGRRVLVAGLGVTGRAVRDVLRARGAVVTTLDEHTPEADVADPGAVDLSTVDLVVASPGWPPAHPLLAGARGCGVPVWSEVELAWRLRAERTPAPDGTPRGRAPWVVVTGTNGKTTTVGMLSSILTAAGHRAPAVGNVGTPVVTAATDPDVDVLAVELSSFQLHHTTSMSAHAAAILNIAPDHLDWHGGMEGYVADKARVYERAVLACVYDAADPRLERLVEAADVVEGARAVGFTRGAPTPGQLGVIDDLLVDRAFHTGIDDPDRRGSAAELATLGDLAHLAGPTGAVAPHVVANALAAAALARAVGVPASAVRDGLRAFPAGEHRAVVVRQRAGVAYVDDSKATNAHAASASLVAYPAGTVVWIAGGLAKGATFDELVAARADRLHAVVLIGVDATPWETALARHAPEVPVLRVDPTETGTVMTRAVDSARRLARPGDTVLLAPASASMDQFVSYADRGERFAAAVRALDEGGPSGPTS